MFAPKYETSSDIVTNKKVAQLIQKRKGCQIILNFTFRHPAPLPPKAEREREREREKERRKRERGKYVHQEGTAANRWKKF